MLVYKTYEIHKFIFKCRPSKTILRQRGLTLQKCDKNV